MYFMTVEKYDDTAANYSEFLCIDGWAMDQEMSTGVSSRLCEPPTKTYSMIRNKNDDDVYE